MLRAQAILCMLFAAVAVQAKETVDELLLAAEEAPPYSMMVNGKIVGIRVDKINKLMSLAKLPYTMEIMPWARAYKMALEKSNVCVFSTLRTAEREPKFKWVGPLAIFTSVLYGLADANIHLNTLEDARPFRIGTHNADARDTSLRAKGFIVDTAMTDEVNPRKLLAKRIDLWVSSQLEAEAQINANGWTGQIVPLLTYDPIETYLACNPGVSDEVVNKLNVILKGMSKD
ncbi:substrate-binding periplasmic protein [Chitinimonas sp. BJB300]|uniref:substrate-binding periplasmic protein n=1 Tax=Chitinimonas sp. BJB300 TaxID=1559339 RepID=UPI000C0EAB74|nr:ABC transporter substrate-binding protein [Chitinimonas sp. BJB300]PHV11933.1 hypothetical protein CSQ89_08400 [Chitinimonas sp. BJB300]TSJ84473.1 ABC transporter substrate-binding protein [Chitinimonas sp. BJB300]